MTETIDEVKAQLEAERRKTVVAQDEIKALRQRAEEAEGKATAKYEADARAAEEVTNAKKELKSKEDALRSALEAAKKLLTPPEPER